MHRIDGANAGPGNSFVAGNPFNDTPGTQITAAWLQAVQEELARVIEGAGITLDKGRADQLLLAIQNSAGLGVAQREALHAGALPLLAPAAALHPIRESRAPIRLVGAAGRWTAGQTTSAPTDANTEQATEFTTGIDQGESWPYMVPTALVGWTGGNGKFPHNPAGAGHNCYRDGFVLPRGMFTAGSELRIYLAGKCLLAEGGRTFELIVEADKDPSSPGIDSQKGIGFISSSMTTSANQDYWACEMRLRSISVDSTDHEILAQTRFTVADSNSTAPVIDDERIEQVPWQTSKFSPETLDHLMNVRFKTATITAALGEEGGTAGNGTQDGSTRFQCLRYEVDLIPSGV